jgi:hypothetical protein
MSPDDALKMQIERYRRMTPEERTRLAFELSEFACDISRAGIRSQHPQASKEDVERELRRRLALARQ